MMISQSAVNCLNATWQHLMRRSVREVGPEATQVLQLAALEDTIQGDIAAPAEASLIAAAVGGESPAPAAREQGPALGPRSMSRRLWPLTSGVHAPPHCGL